MKSLRDDIQYLKGIGPSRAACFRKKGIASVEDLLYFFPRRYEDRRSFCPISRLQAGQAQTIRARVLAIGERRSFRRRGFSVLEASVGDDTGRLTCVWFNQPFLKRYFAVGSELIMHGKAEVYGGRMQMTAPEFEPLTEGDESLASGRIVPVYSVPQRMSQRVFRSLMYRTLEHYLPAVADDLPYDIRARNGLMNLAKSLRQIHFPDNEETRFQAYERLAFDEFLLFQVPLALRKLQKSRRPGISHRVDAQTLERFIAGLPFRLTDDQRTVLNEISADMRQPHAMQRLLQGDVGSGKTVVATIAALIAVRGGYQAAIMAPTEILARQHFKKITEQVSSVRARRQGSGGQGEAGNDQSRHVSVGLLSAASKAEEKSGLLEKVRDGSFDIVVGTHALLEAGVQFNRLGLVVIDEQHKFGVGQRALIQEKGSAPDVLIMTATPIPRTLAITIYADLDISVIRHLPPGRKPVTTLHYTREQRETAYWRARDEVKRGHQVYIVYPVIEESYALDIAGAESMYEKLRNGAFRDCRVSLLHGKMKTKAQDEVMAGFKSGQVDVLVATTILEVGIDVANATCMIIEHAERFGLSQLHQLRGRVGRGSDESVCILVGDPVTEESAARMRAMVKYADGFRIAEEDLKIRGPGEFFGERQHGLTDLRIGNPLTQLQLLKRARDEATKIAAADPRLQEREHVPLKAKLLQRFPEYEKTMMIG